MQFLVWLLRAFVFFTLFAFALNNQHTAVVKGFFGVEWHTPMVIVVLAAFGAGCTVGVLAMMPGWWWRRRQAQHRTPQAAPPAPPVAAAPAESGFEHPPREGL